MKSSKNNFPLKVTGNGLFSVTGLILFKQFGIHFGLCVNIPVARLREVRQLRLIFVIVVLLFLHVVLSLYLRKRLLFMKLPELSVSMNLVPIASKFYTLCPFII